MDTKLQNAIIGGIVATIVMTVVMFVAPMMSMPEMDSPKMLVVTIGFPVAVGWIMHFMIGIVFAMGYAYLFLPQVSKISSKVAKGAIYGVIIFVFAQIMMQVLGAMFPAMPSPEGSMALMIIGSVIGHVIFGIVVALFFKNRHQDSQEI